MDAADRGFLATEQFIRIALAIVRSGQPKGEAYMRCKDCLNPIPENCSCLHSQYRGRMIQLVNEYLGFKICVLSKVTKPPSCSMADFRILMIQVLPDYSYDIFG